MTITLDRVIATVRDIAEERPDFVYENFFKQLYPSADSVSCQYVLGEESNNDQQAGCIIGHVMHKLGVSYNSMSAYEGESASTLIAGLLNIDTYYRFQSDEQRAKFNWLDNVQSWQDCGLSWSSSVEQADKRNPLPK